MVTKHTDDDTVAIIKEESVLSRKDSLIKYLGGPLYIGIQRIIYYSELVDKVTKRITSWQSKILCNNLS